jgi:hypothetical protein
VAKDKNITPQKSGGMLFIFCHIITPPTALPTHSQYPRPGLVLVTGVWGAQSAPQEKNIGIYISSINCLYFSLFCQKS